MDNTVYSYAMDGCSLAFIEDCFNLYGDALIDQMAAEGVTQEVIDEYSEAVYDRTLGY